MDSLKGRVVPLKISQMKDDELDKHYNRKYWDEIENQFTTGDVILCRGTESFSQLIRRGTMSTWSHAALVVVDPPAEVREAYKIDATHEKDLLERVFIFESDTETQDKRAGGGTQLFPLRRWMECCCHDYTDNYLVVWRKLKRPDHFHGKPDLELFPAFFKFMLEMSKRSYEHSRVQLMFSAIHTNKKEDLSTIFCSELVAASFKNMGLFAPDTNSNNFVPRDFTSDERLDGKDIKINNGYTLDKEVRFRFRPSDGTELFLGVPLHTLTASDTNK